MPNTAATLSSYGHVKHSLVIFDLPRPGLGLVAVEKILDRDIIQTPTLTVVRRQKESVGN
jgi:hypothetical protein